jgi:iron complex transport system substrate-binding protein
VALKRIISLLPAATELACSIGLEQQIAGISFECNYPPTIIDRPRVVSTSLPTHNMTLPDIDAAVSRKMRNGESLYAIDENLLKKIRPDIILTQDLCHVCAPSGNELSQALASLDYSPEVIFMTPHSLSDIQDNLRELAHATGRELEAEKVIAGWKERTDKVRARGESMKRKPRVFMMEWVDPIYCCGHWLAEMVEICGGEDKFGRKGEDSVHIPWAEILDWQPELILVAPCGYNEAQAARQIPLL